MQNFAPIYTNTGGKNIINTLQRKHVIAVLNAKSIVKQSFSHTQSSNKLDLKIHKKTPKINSYNKNNELLYPQLMKSKTLHKPIVKITHSPPHNDNHSEVRSLLRNLISIDKKSISNIKNLRKTLKSGLKKPPKKQKLFYVSDFITRKKGLNIISKTTLDKLLPVNRKFDIKHQTPQKKMKVRSLSSNNSLNKLKTASEDKKINMLVSKRTDEIVQGIINENKMDELFESLQPLFESKEVSSIKKKLVLYLVKNKILELEDFEKLKKGLSEKFEKTHSEEFKFVIGDIENHIFK